MVQYEYNGDAVRAQWYNSVVDKKLVSSECMEIVGCCLFTYYRDDIDSAVTCEHGGWQVHSWLSGALPR